MSEARTYLVVYTTFEMHRQPQTEQRVQVVRAYTAADALTDVRLRLKEGTHGDLRTTITAVVPPTTERHEKLMEEAELSFRYMDQVVPYHDVEVATR